MNANENRTGGEVILYQTEDLQTRVQVRLEGETAWLLEAYVAAGWADGANISPKSLHRICTDLGAILGLHNFCTNLRLHTFCTRILTLDYP
jgi:hypothetical protein